MLVQHIYLYIIFIYGIYTPQYMFQRETAHVRNI
jgi:hypothetical protein